MPQVKKQITDDATSLFEFAALPNINKPVASADGTGPAPARRFSGIAYSGEMIPNHYWWGNVIFDLSTITTPAKAFPALVNHDGDEIAGFIDEFEISDAEGVKIGGPLIYADGYQGKYIADGSDAGFPWQMSVCIKPGSIEEVQAGTNIVVNGRTLQGPVTVFRNSRLSEVSFTPTGWDANTSAAAMSRANSPQHLQPSPHEEASMTPEEQARMTKLEADLAAANGANTSMKASLDAATVELTAVRTNARTAAVTQLFSDLKREVKVDSAEYKELMALPDTSFSVVAGMMRTQTPAPQQQERQQLNPALFSDTAVAKDKDGNPIAPAPKAGEHGLVANAMQRAEQMSKNRQH